MIIIEEKISVVIDTSSLMNRNNILSDLIDKNYQVILNIVAIEELDHLKQNSNFDISYKARKAIKEIKKYESEIIFDKEKKVVPSLLNNNIQDFNYNDNIIISTALYNNAYLLSDDLNVCIKAKSFDIKIFEIDKIKENYTGYIDRVVTNEELSENFTNRNNNIYNCLTNQYVILRNTDNKVVAIMKWNGEEYKNISYKTFDSEYMGEIKPINLQQKLAFDMLQDNEITIKVLSGEYGSGKDYLMISNALQLVKNKKYKKIIWCRNNIELKNSKPIGFLPNGIKDKLLPFAMIIADHVGGEDKLNAMIDNNKLEIQHLGFMRGRDIKDSIIMCSEAENMTKEQIQLLIGRVGKNSALWLNGDYHQVDDKVFEFNNGLMTAIERLKGQRRFGFVKLQDIERSETAKLADLLD